MKLFFKKFSLCLCVFAVLILFSCSNKPIDTPKNILTKTEMVPVLVDMHLVQAVVGVNQQSDSLRYSINDYVSSIFKLHHITKEKYDSSLQFYTAHPELLDEIYAEVINELSKKQSESERK